MPTGMVRFPNSRRTSSGVAEVAKSQSRWGWPSNASRIAPPTHQASNPASSSRPAMSRTGPGGLSGVIGWKEGLRARLENTRGRDAIEGGLPLQLGAPNADILGD